MDTIEKTLVVILGKSGSGKDAACQYLQLLHDVPMLHPMQQMKAVWENSAGLEPGSMHTKEGKSTVVGDDGNAPVTLGDLEIQMYHWLKHRHPKFAANLLFSELTATFSTNRVASVRGIRNIAEVEVILRAQAVRIFQQLLVVKLESPQSLQISTDGNLEIIFRMLEKKAFFVTTYRNDHGKGFAPLLDFLDDIMDVTC